MLSEIDNNESDLVIPIKVKLLHPKSDLLYLHDEKYSTSILA